MRPEPQVLGRFELRAQIGEGAMGVVYDAWDRERGERVAIKRLRNLRPEDILRFKREFRSLQDVVHPNLVRLHELYEQGGQWFFSMEHIDGVPFSAYVRPADPGDAEQSLIETILTQTLTRLDGISDGSGGSGGAPGAIAVPGAADFDEARLRHALAQLAAGLGALHHAGKVHRDIKPSNVLVTGEGRVVILDFGLVTEAATEPRGRPDRHVVGTVLYMAPEQAASASVGKEADWYSVGVMLYHALTGRLPITGPVREVLHLKQRVEPPPPRELVPRVPAELSELCTHLLSISPSQRASGRDVLAALGMSQPTEQQGAELDFIGELVGRETELSQLHELLRRAEAGGPLAAVVTGVSGVGKSALVRTFIDSLADTARVFAGRCYERESVPFKALDEVVDSLARHLVRLPPAVAASLLPGRLPALLQLFPVLRRVPAVRERLAGLETTAGLDPQLLRAQAFLGLRELLSAVGQKGPPLVLLIDDLQWADADSRLLLHELLAGPGAPRLLLLGTVRTAPDDPDHLAIPAELRQALPVPLEEIALRNLPDESAQALCERLLQQAALTLPAVEIAELVRECRGHPMLLEVLLRHRLEQPRGRQPVRLDEALWARCQALPPDARELLALCALTGGPIRQDHVAQAAGCDLATVARLGRLLVAQDLLRTRGSGPTDPIEPFHDRVRETVVAHLGGAERERLHATLARTLLATLSDEGGAAGSSHSEALARHLEGSGQPALAAHHAEQAATQAIAVLAFHRAARLLRWALALQQQAQAGTEAERGRLFVRLGETLANAGRGREAADALLAACELCPEEQSLDLTRRAAEQLLVSGHIQRGVTVLEEVTQRVGLRVPASPARALAALIYYRGRLWLRGLDFVETRADAVDPRVLRRLDCCWSASIGLAMVENLRGAALQTQTLLLALTAGEPYRIARSLGLEACFVATMGYGAERQAAALCERAQQLAERVGNPHALGLAAAGAAVSAFLLGRWRRGFEKSGEALRILRERATGVTWEIDSMQLFETWCLWHLGEVGPLRRRLLGYLREAEERGDLYALTCLRLLHGSSVWLASDEPEVADREVAAALAGWELEDARLKKYRGYKLQHHYAFYAQAENDLYSRRGLGGYYRLRGQWPGLERAQLLRIQHTRIAMTSSRARCALQGSELAVGRGEREGLLQSAARDARSLLGEGAPWATALGNLSLAAVRRSEGDPVGAAVLLGRVATAFAELDMPLHAAAACRRRGELEGGYIGDALIAHADESLRSRGVVRPARLAHSLAPGFPEAKD